MERIGDMAVCAAQYDELAAEDDRFSHDASNFDADDDDIRVNICTVTEVAHSSNMSRHVLTAP